MCVYAHMCASIHVCIFASLLFASCISYCAVCIYLCHTSSLMCVYVFLGECVVHGFMVSVCHAVLICDVCLSLCLLVQQLVCISVCDCHWLYLCIYLCVWVQYVCPCHMTLYPFHITPLLQWTEAGHPFSSWRTIIGLNCDGNRQLSL